MPARRLVIALALLLLPAPMLVAGSGEQLLDLMPVHEWTPGVIDCDLPKLSLSDQRLLSSTVTTFSLVNDSSFATMEYVVIDVVLAGQSRMFWTEISVGARARVSVQVEFLTRPEASAIRVCKNRPGGITEGPDPIMPVSVGIPLD